MKDPIVQALYQKYKGHIAEAKANVDIYLHNPAGIGESRCYRCNSFSNTKNI